MDKIELLRSLLNTYLNPAVQVVRGEELSKTPPYPYVEMFIINMNPDFHVQNEEIVIRNGETLKEENLKFYTSVLQLNCRHRSNLEALNLAQGLYRLINYEKRDDIINKGLGIKRMSIIKTLNYIEAGKWTYCYSFDIEISFDVLESKEIGTIERVETKINDEEVTLNE